MSTRTLPRCDCLDHCGDDPALERGTVMSCSKRVHWLARPRIVGVSRVADDPRTLAVHFSAEPSNDDLRALHRFDRWPSP